MKIRDMVLVALFAAIVAVLGYLPAIPIPLIPVPITAQTLGVMLAGSVLGARRGGLSILILVLLAAVGAPVLSGGTGGLARLLGPTGGYVLSWPIAAFIIGFLVEKSWDHLRLWKLILINILGGIIIIYAIGIPYLSRVTGIPFTEALIGNFTFIPGDIVKGVVAAIITLQIKKAYPIIKSENK